MAAGEVASMAETSTSRDGFRSLVRELAEDLGVKVAFVCEVVGDERDQARTLALSVDGCFLEEMTYRLAGTPCARVCQRGVNYEARNVARSYPEDTALADWGVDSYMGVAFFDSRERLIGHVGVMNDAPLDDPTRVETRLRAAAQGLGPLVEKRSGG